MRFLRTIGALCLALLTCFASAALAADRDVGAALLDAELAPAPLEVPVDHYEGFTAHAELGGGARVTADATAAPIGALLAVGSVCVAACVALLDGSPDALGALGALATAAPAMPEDVLKEIKGLTEQAKKAFQKADEAHEEAQKAAESGKGAAEAKELANKAIQDLAGINEKIETAVKAATERQDEFEAEIKARIGGSGPSMDAGIDEAIKSLMGDGTLSGAGQRRRAKIKGFGKAVTALPASGGPLLVPHHQADIVAPGTQPITVLDMITVTPVPGEAAAVDYPRELALTNGFAAQSDNYTGNGQGTALGETDFTFERVTDNVKTAGHKGKIALQMLKHESQLRGYLEGRVRYLTRAGIEGDVIAGDGTGNKLTGINERATAYDATLDSQFGLVPGDMTIMDVLRLAMYQANLSEYAPDSAILNQRELAILDLEKDGDNRYLFANPLSNNELRPWGLRTATTRRQGVDTFTVGNLAMNVQAWMAEDVTFEIATENADDFEKLLATWRSYVMMALSVYRPSAIVTGTFTAARAA